MGDLTYTHIMFHMFQTGLFVRNKKQNGQKIFPHYGDDDIVFIGLLNRSQMKKVWKIYEQYRKKRRFAEFNSFPM